MNLNELRKRKSHSVLQESPQLEPEYQKGRKGLRGIAVRR